MKCYLRFICIAASLSLAASPGMVHAAGNVQQIDIPSVTDTYTKGSKSYLLALNDVASPSQNQAGEAQAAQPAEFESPLFSGSNAHKYLGLGTLALVVATAIAPKPPEVEGRAPTQAELDAQDSSAHAKLGRAAATLAAATAVSGLLTHWDDFHLEDGLSDPDNLHALLGTAGALAMLAAVNQAPEGGHAGVGMAGGVGMAIAIKLTW